MTPKAVLRAPLVAVRWLLVLLAVLLWILVVPLFDAVRGCAEWISRRLGDGGRATRG